MVLPVWSDHGCIIESGYSVFGGPPFIPMKAAQMTDDFPGLHIPGSEAVPLLCLSIMWPLEQAQVGCDSSSSVWLQWSAHFPGLGYDQ